MIFTTKWLSKWFTHFQGSIDEGRIEAVFTDSRKQVANGLFIPLEGENFDGHTFIDSAIDQGAVATFWNREKELPAHLPKDFPVFFVEDTLVALQQLAHQYRMEINPTVIGVTGSNGKTTTKDLIGSVLGVSFQTHRTAGNYNNHIGLPLTILSMPRGTEMLVLEMGMNHFGEIEQLSTIAQPDYAIITNIGESHIEYLGSREGIAQAKTEILAGMKESGRVFLDGDEPLLAPLHTRERVVSCGYDGKNRCHITNVSMSERSTTFTINDTESYEIGMLGKHNVKNASYAIMLGKAIGMEPVHIQEGLHSIEMTGMRFETVDGPKSSIIINDAYNASPTSMEASIGVVKEMDVKGKRIVVLGDIFELGAHRDEFHRQVAQSVTSPIDLLLTVGEASALITEEVRREEAVEAKHFTTKEDLVRELNERIEPHSLILLKASRGMKLETILDELTY
ncbi:UDP-N-acetylmuramoylalanyl-D-glutamate--2,6-diaminopimelate ligase [Pontibacillus halophilus JSM 076056 = DSM 19796]|uniref:UDP-N-acetylmuramoyl-tripeptide--D-alanyl-D-alanine ligase n=1 Tax=Pontibacillus halophilus JSM 076056 = DSM 19796 TaxID=1385510 RepID=A0A0A5GMN9_9BACI|nr:UDP-N-acetylmuramoyl-tripeptide--D-alanyl-D-alanine ligase [Pontibacillus halophilus]KGX93264.1 UDP-N-acetylmuramoylalanyl-D-glutamate--2,6-diaminopimelate ligase [Pontibacillus halophilus JSM 076056 = DSM 19796]